jgi:hypothetical protein
MKNRNLLIVIAAVVFSCVLGGFAQAQDGARLTPALALARLCVSEAGWDCFERGDGLAIHEVILRGADRQGMRYETFARSYARRLFGARPHDVARLRWVGEMNAAGDAPRSWPSITMRRRGGVTAVEAHAPWSTYRARWLAVFSRAQEVVTEMTLDDVDEWGICDRAVHDWGGWMDRDRAARIGLVEVACGVDPDGTRNDFYCRPGTDPTCVDADPE